MTEKELQELEQEALANPIDPEAKRQWLIKQRVEMEQAEQETMCSFTLHRFLRKDEAMKANAAALRDIRAAIAYINAELGNAKS